MAARPRRRYAAHEAREPLFTRPPQIMEIVETGNLRRIEHERTEDVASVQAFLGVYGVG